MFSDELNYYLGFNCFLKIGPQKFKRLLNFFGTAEKAFKANANALEQSGIEPEIIQLFLAFREQFDFELEQKKLQVENISLCPIISEHYPPLLKEIYNPPYLLYVKGDITCLKNSFNFAIVGTRRISPYGKQVSHEMGYELSRQGLTIVSGGAQGCDTCAHQGALEAQGKTTAVLAGGLDETCFFPKDNTNLFRKIIETNGALLSEFPPGTQAKPFYFPNRNRIVSGLSKGVLIVEAPEESGALITAECALEQNREVFAIPGNIYNPVAVGPNRLIQKGAQLVYTASQIIQALNLEAVISFKKAREVIPDNPLEAKILEHLGFEPMYIDKISASAGLKSPEVAATLASMELKGKVRNLGGMNYVRAH